MTTRLLTLALLLGIAPLARPADWPTLGRDATRNPATSEKGAPTTWRLRSAKDAPTPNVRWDARIDVAMWGGSSGPVVAGGLVWIGGHQRRRVDPKPTPMAAVLKCFRASDGALLWQYESPRLPEPAWDPEPRIACAPLVEGDRLYFTTNRGEVVAFDIGPLKAGKGEPRLLWKLDMPAALGVRRADVQRTCWMYDRLTCSIPPSFEGRLYVSTGNSRDLETNAVPAPKAPSLVCLDARTGKPLWSDASPGKDIIYSQWSSPLVATVGGKAQVLHAQGDGWLRSFDARTGALLWEFDLNPKKAAPYKFGGAGERNFPTATPVLYEGRVYIGTGQDPDDGPSVGHLWCIDVAKATASKAKEVSPVGDNFDPKHPANKGSALVWHYGGKLAKPLEDGREWAFGRTLSNVAVHDGLLVANDPDGYVHCLDARTGKQHWEQDVNDRIFGPPLIADGKVYVSGSSEVWVFALSARKRVLARNPGLGGRSGPIFANGTLYLTTQRSLYAIRGDGPGKPPEGKPAPAKR